MVHNYTMTTAQKKDDVHSVLKEYKGQSLTITQLSQITGLTVNEVKKEVEYLVYQGGDVCYYKGKVFIANSTNEFPVYLVLTLVVGFVAFYSMVQQFIAL